MKIFNLGGVLQSYNLGYKKRIEIMLYLSLQVRLSFFPTNGVYSYEEPP